MTTKIQSKVALLGISLCGLIPISGVAAAPIQPKTIPASSSMIVTQHELQQTIYVNPQTGNDSNSGQSEANAFSTISMALQNATSGTTIVLAPGHYAQGEKFPLIIKSGVTVIGNENEQGNGVTIAGSGAYLSRFYFSQNVTIVPEGNSQILGVTVTNSETRGTAIWVEDSNPTIRNSTFINNDREGIFLSGNAVAKINNNIFSNNHGNGIAVGGSARGEIRGNQFHHTGYALAIAGASSPLIDNNQIQDNRIGIVITQTASPTIQHNSFDQNTDNDLVYLAQAKPNIAANNNFQKEPFNVTAQNTRYAANDPNNPNNNLPYFICKSAEGNSFATVVARVNSTKTQTLVNWTRSIQLSPDETLTPYKRCEQATDRLNELIEKYGVNTWEELYFTNGVVNNNPVICLVRGKDNDCDHSNILFRLTGENASNPLTAKAVLNEFALSISSNTQDDHVLKEDHPTSGQTYVDVLGKIEKNLPPDDALWFVNGSSK